MPNELLSGIPLTIIVLLVALAAIKWKWGEGGKGAVTILAIVIKYGTALLAALTLVGLLAGQPLTWALQGLLQAVLWCLLWLGKVLIFIGTALLNFAEPHIK